MAWYMKTQGNTADTASSDKALTIETSFALNFKLYLQDMG